MEWRGVRGGGKGRMWKEGGGGGGWGGQGRGGWLIDGEELRWRGWEHGWVGVEWLGGGGRLLEPLIECRLSRRRLLQLIQCPLLFFSVNFDGDEHGVFSLGLYLVIVNFDIIVVFVGCLNVILALGCGVNVVVKTVVLRLSNLVHSFAQIVTLRLWRVGC